MPYLQLDLISSIYVVIVGAAIIVALIGLVVLVRLMLAATRALAAYTDDRKLRTALLLDDVAPAGDALVRSTN